MAQSIDLSANAMVGLTRETLVSLCAALLRENGTQAAMHLQNAGYSGGATLFEAFSQWLLARGYGAPEAQPASLFGQRATQFFGELGWGSVALGTVGDSVASVDSGDWAESDPSSALEFPGCYLTTGLFADFFCALTGRPAAAHALERR